MPAPRRFPTPCIDCHAISMFNRCPACTKRWEQSRGSSTARGYGADWRAVRAAAIAAAPRCVDCGHTGSPENPLTGDHRVPLARGGTRTPRVDEVDVRCRSCNARRGKGDL